ncbi:hypothetical protein D3C73_1475550 [compost metagenome]
MTDHQPLDQPAQAEGHGKGQQDGDEEVGRHQPGRVLLDQFGTEIGAIGAHRQELAMGHVDDAHLAKDDRQAQGHQQQHAENR